MADMIKIFTGMQSGPEMIDKNFKQVFPKVVTNQKGGLVFQNGFADLGSHYDYVQCNGYKIVHLVLQVSLPTNGPTSKQEVIATYLPNEISFSGYTEYNENDKYRWSFNESQARLSIINDSVNGWWTGNGSHYIAALTYMHID